MLQSMREKMQGIIAGIIVGLIGIAFALWGVQYYLRSTSETGIIAKVDKEQITEQQVKKVLTGFQRQMLAQQNDGTVLDDKQQAVLKKQITNQFIQNLVVADLAKKLDLYIGFLQIQAGIKQIPVLQSSDGKFSPTKFQQFLSNLGYSEASFVKEMQDNLMLSQMEKGLVDSSFLMPYEKDMVNQLLLQQRDISYTIINADKFINQVKVTDEEIQNYYNIHQHDYVTPEKVSLEYIELNTDIVAQNIANNVNDTQLKSFYNEHKDLFVKQTKETKEIKEVKKEKEKQETKKIEKAQEVKDNFSDVKDQVKSAYIHQMTQQKLAEENEQLADLTYTNSDSLEKASQELGLKIQTTDLFTSDYKIAKNTKNLTNAKDTNDTKDTDNNIANNANILSNPKVIKNAFSETVLRQGYNSNVIELSDNRYVVIRIKQHIPESSMPLTQVKNSILDVLQREKAHDFALNQAQDITQKIQSGVSLEKISQDYGIKFQEITNLDRNYKNVDLNILQLSFKLPQPQYIQAEQQKFSVGSTSLKNNNVAIVKINKVYNQQNLDSNTVNQQENAKQKAKEVKDVKDTKEDTQNNANDLHKIFDKLVDNVRSNLGQFEYQSLISSFAQHMKIKMMTESKENNNV